MMLIHACPYTERLLLELMNYINISVSVMEEILKQAVSWILKGSDDGI
jgi:hypothetical protein